MNGNFQLGHAAWSPDYKRTVEAAPAESGVLQQRLEAENEIKKLRTALSWVQDKLEKEHSNSKDRHTRATLRACCEAIKRAMKP